MKILTKVLLAGPERYHPEVIAWRSGAPAQRVTLSYLHNRDAVECERNAALALIRELKLRGVTVEQTGESEFTTKPRACCVRGCDEPVIPHPWQEIDLKFCADCSAEQESWLIERDELNSWAD